MSRIPDQPIAASAEDYATSSTGPGHAPRFLANRLLDRWVGRSGPGAR